MRLSLGSLKLRLAMAGAVLICLSVGVTVLYAVHELRRHAERNVLDSALDTDKIAAALASVVVERQRTLAAAALAWPADGAGKAGQSSQFLATQKVLEALFDRVIVDTTSRSDPDALTRIAAPSRRVQASGRAEIEMSVSLGDPGVSASRLVGILDIGGRNFLATTAQSSYESGGMQTVIANQEGFILASPRPQQLSRRIDDDPVLRPFAQRWRALGSPLEPAPWAERIGGRFYAMAAVPGTDWVVFRIAEVDAVFGRASQSILQTIALGSGVVLVGALLLFGITMRFLRPMELLQRRALRALEPGQIPSEGWPAAEGEVGELSRILRHVSEQVSIGRDAVEQALRRMEVILALAPAGIAFTSGWRVELTSRQLETLLGYEAGELIGKDLDDLLADIDRQQLRGEVEDTFRQGRIFEAELALRRRDGGLVWALTHGSAVDTGNGERQAIWLFTDVTERREQREKLEWTATHDPLTNLVNRRDFDRKLGEIVNDRRRAEHSSALFIDLDHFKQVNDNAGHAAGDELLQRISKTLTRHVRSQDTVGRLGGDEFAVILRSCRIDEAMQIAEKIRAAVERDGVWDAARSLRVTASIGVVEIGAEHTSLQAVLEAADQACYAAKKSGRNAVRSAPSAAAAPR